MDRRLAAVPLALLVPAGCTGDGEDDGVTTRVLAS